MRALKMNEVGFVGGGVMGGGRGPGGVPLLNCGDTANDQANRVDGLAGMTGVDNVYQMATGRDLTEDVRDFSYEACMGNGVYGTNQNLDTYDPPIGLGRAMCGLSPCPTSRTTTLGGL
jgi:hypothetical protein